METSAKIEGSEKADQGSKTPTTLLELARLIARQAAREALAAPSPAASDVTHTDREDRHDDQS